MMYTEYEIIDFTHELEYPPGYIITVFWDICYGCSGEGQVLYTEGDYYIDEIRYNDQYRDGGEGGPIPQPDEEDIGTYKNCRLCRGLGGDSFERLIHKYDRMDSFMYDK